MLTLQIVPYHEIEGLTPLGKIRKLLNIAKDNKIVLLQGKLRKDEEIELIKATMEEINKDFKGIELAVIDSYAQTQSGGLDMLKKSLFSMMLGNRLGLTIIGPASIVKEIKKDPSKIELFTKDSNSNNNSNYNNNYRKKRR